MSATPRCADSRGALGGQTAGRGGAEGGDQAMRWSEPSRPQTPPSSCFKQSRAGMSRMAGGTAESQLASREPGFRFRHSLAVWGPMFSRGLCTEAVGLAPGRHFACAEAGDGQEAVGWGGDPSEEARLFVGQAGPPWESPQTWTGRDYFGQLRHQIASSVCFLPP